MVQLGKVRLLVLLTGIIAAFGSESYAEKIKVGVLIPLSGDFAEFGALNRRGIEQAHRQESIELIFEDEACDPKTTLSSYNKLVKVDKVKFILGPGCGSPQSVVAPLLPRDEVLAMMTSSAPEKLSSLSKGNIFSAQYAIETEARFIAQEMNKRNLQRAGIVFYDNQFSRAHEAAFRQAFQGTVVRTIAFSSIDAQQVKSAALELKRKQADSVFVPDAWPLMMGFMKQLHAMGLGDIQVFSVYSAQMEGVLTGEGEHANGLLYSYPDEAQNDAMGYFPKKAAEMLFTAIEACESPRLECVKDELHKRYDFSEKNYLRSSLTLKTVRDGKFQRLKD